MAYIKTEIQKSVKVVIRNRIRDLMNYSILSTNTLETLLISAYCQGIYDLIETQESSSNNKTEEES